MRQTLFPPLHLAEWRATRDTLHTCARLVGSIRQALMPPQKHWWHISLRASACGLTTTPMPAGNRTCELTLDLTSHDLTITTSRGDWWDVPLEGQSSRELRESVLGNLEAMGVKPKIEREPFASEATNPYDADAVDAYWQALSQMDLLLKQFKGELREETSPVQLWPHHFDLSLVWFSGRRVPGVAPANAEEADEQMAFGFSTGDEGTAEPYFYVTAYPWPEGLEETTLPAGACWQQKGWQGALLPYHALPDSDSQAYLLDFWRTVQRAGATRMSA